ncbi:hypothetical protein J4205_03040 [Candidatus Pacearchaeota archaeon]|nr:hypothetical protein [Candidatus Pacearchaeota archaeon]
MERKEITFDPKESERVKKFLNRMGSRSDSELETLEKGTLWVQRVYYNTIESREYGGNRCDNHMAEEILMMPSDQPGRLISYREEWDPVYIEETLAIDLVRRKVLGLK